MRRITRVLSKTLWLFSAIFILTACGGGDSVSRDDSDGSDDGNGSSATVNVVLTVQNASGETDRNLTSDNALTVIATVTDTDGVAQTDQLVTFALSNTDLAVFGNDTGTARTDDNGVARITINASTASGDGEITGSLSSGETGSTTFSAVGIPVVEPLITVSLELVNSSGEADSSLSTENTLTALTTVFNNQGEPQEDLLVTFSLDNEDLAVFGNDTGTARTNENGIASINLLVGNASGDGELTATLATGESDTTTFSSTGAISVGEEPDSLQFYASAVQLASSGSDDIELIALVKNDQSVLMEGVDVNFSASNDDGVELQLTQPVTTADGTARAILSSQNDASNRTVTITAETGALVQTIDIDIVGTEVTINGPSTAILNDTVEYTLRVQDSDGVAIPNQTILIEAENGSFSESSVTAGANGQATVDYTATTSGQDTIRASSLNAITSFTVQVQQDEFSFFSNPAEEIPLGTEVEISIEWNQDNLPVIAGNVTFTASRGTISTPNTVTGSDGIATFSISSSNAGFSSITATGRDDEGNELVTATLDIEFIATVPYYLQADATPDIIGPDGQTSTITAIVRDENDNLVKNAVVSFNVDDPSTGTISPSQATTDSNGVASTVYTSGAVSSHDSVIVTAAVATEPSVTDDVLLTVGNRAFDITLGTGNIIQIPDDSSYLKEFAVFVSDSAGQPVSGVELTASVSPVKFVNGGGYLQGEWTWSGTVWFADTPVYFCENEDQNDNGILDVSPDDGSSYDEDTNDDGFLTPGIVGTVSFISDAISDENGQATIALRYPKNYGNWLDVVISVYGQSTGSEARADMTFGLSVAASELDDETNSPAPNPFGGGPSTGCILLY